MTLRRLLFALLFLCALEARAQCTLTNQLTCPEALQVGQSGTCTLVTRNSGSESCSGFVAAGMVGFDDAASESLVRFSNASSQLGLCLDDSSFPEFEFQFAYCFSEAFTFGPGQTITTTATVELLAEPANGVLQIFGFSAVFDEDFEFIAESEPAVANIVAGTAGCVTPRAPLARAPATATPNEIYTVRWLPIAGVSSFEIEESLSPDFSSPNRQTAQATGASFQHAANTATPYYYRVRGIADCNQSVGAFSNTVRTVVTPPPDPNSTQFDISTPIDNQQSIVFQVFVRSPEASGKQTLDVNFTASTNKAWLTVSPPSGTIPSAGTTLTVTADPKNLPPGGSTGNVVVTNPTTGQSIQNTPVTVNLVAPVAQAGKNTPPDDTLIIPVVAHVEGASSKFQSDIRLSNSSMQPVTYRLAFTPSGTDGTQVGSQTSYRIDPQQTVALNDVLKNAFGVGVLPGEAAGGSLEIRPLDQVSGIPLPGQPQGPSLVASSRTYAITPIGTLGQFIPAIPFGRFIGPGAVLSIQQIADSDSYRTNVGFVEGSGEPASIAVRVIGANGQQLGEFPFTLAPFEHRQINRFLRERNITLNDGRLEIRVTSATGRVMAYASVLDNKTDDPLLVSPVQPAAINVNRYVVPGVADLTNPNAAWRTDMRIYNASPSAIRTTLAYYPQGAPTAPRTAEVFVQPGEVRSIDNTLQALYGLSNSGGSVVVTSDLPAPFVVTARTYNQTGNGTYGQFIPAVTAAEGTGLGERALQILQLEQSTAYRTNVGVFELTGNPATALIEAVIPDSKIALTREIPLQPYEFVQIPLGAILGAEGGGANYNVRASVRVISGNGRVSAYGSVIDGKTQDPTYVPAQ